MTTQTRIAAYASLMALALVLFANKIMETTVFQHICCFDGQNPPPLKFTAWTLATLTSAVTVLSLPADPRQERN